METTEIVSWAALVISVLSLTLNTIISYYHAKRMWKIKHHDQHVDAVVSGYLRNASMYIETRFHEHKVEYTACFAEALNYASGSIRETMLELDDKMLSLPTHNPSETQIAECRALLRQIAMNAKRIK